MAQKPFDVVAFNPLEKPRSEDWNNLQSQLYRTLRDMALRVYGTRTDFNNDNLLTINGFIGDGFKVRPGAGMTIVITPGYGFINNAADVPAGIGGLVNMDDLCSFKPVGLTVPEVVIVPTAPGANSRIDIVEVRYDRRMENSLQREQLNTVTGAFDGHAFLKTMAFDLTGRQGIVAAGAPSTTAIGYKVGNAAVMPVAPTVTPGYVQIGQINVDHTTVAMDDSILVDWRPLLAPGGVLQVFVDFAVARIGGLPIIKEIVAPPGVRVAITSDVAAGGAPYTVSIIAGKGRPDATTGDWIGVTALGDTLTVPGTFLPVTQWSVVDTTMRTLLANAAKTAPTLAVGIGQQILTSSGLSTAVANGGGGAVNIGNVVDPTRYRLQAALRLIG